MGNPTKSRETINERPKRKKVIIYFEQRAPTVIGDGVPDLSTGEDSDSGFVSSK